MMSTPLKPKPLYARPAPTPADPSIAMAAAQAKRDRKNLKRAMDAFHAESCGQVYEMTQEQVFGLLTQEGRLLAEMEAQASTVTESADGLSQTFSPIGDEPTGAKP